jgi:hypothetical protein
LRSGPKSVPPTHLPVAAEWPTPATGPAGLPAAAQPMAHKLAGPTRAPVHARTLACALPAAPPLTAAAQLHRVPPGITIRPARPGPARPGSAWPGPSWTVSARPGPAWIGSACPGPVVHRPAAATEPFAVTPVRALMVPVLRPGLGRQPGPVMCSGLGVGASDAGRDTQAHGGRNRPGRPSRQRKNRPPEVPPRRTGPQPAITAGRRPLRRCTLVSPRAEEVQTCVPSG